MNNKEAEREGEKLNTLKIKWQRLIADGKTCPRCGSTEEEIERAVSILRQSLAPLGIDVTLEKGELSVEEFEKNPLESNKILINDHPLEEWVSGTVGQSPCCTVCGPSECRTVTVEGQIYETIPAELIVKAGLIAASELINTEKSESCCGNNASKTPKNNCCPK
ncbi:MAG: DUF2703 domain-containing protein [Candidatus Bathyarchaeales archaeon]